MQVICSECKKQVTLASEQWRCSCGGAWEPVDLQDFDQGKIDLQDYSIWRYRRLFGLDFVEPSFRLGVGWTPLVTLDFRRRPVIFKLEFLSPSGSFKDRGMSVMVNILVSEGVKQVADDSSGNAGASLAAHTARAGIKAEIYVPSYASPAKQAQIAVYGAQVRPIPGRRVDAEHAAQQSAAHGTIYASHAYHPGYLIGQQSAAWELWEQLDHQAPDWIVMPVAQGGNLLGYWDGFRRLLSAGLINNMPRLVAVQAAVVAPICQALEQGLETVPAIEPSGTSVAEGVAIAGPVRGRRLLRAIRETGGMALAVGENSILESQKQLALQGLYVEPTSAAALAALDTVYQLAKPEESIVVPLTGSGLKGSPRL